MRSFLWAVLLLNVFNVALILVEAISPEWDRKSPPQRVHRALDLALDVAIGSWAVALLYGATP